MEQEKPLYINRIHTDYFYRPIQPYVFVHGYCMIATVKSIEKHEPIKIQEPFHMLLVRGRFYLKSSQNTPTSVVDEQVGDECACFH